MASDIIARLAIQAQKLGSDISAELGKITSETSTDSFLGEKDRNEIFKSAVQEVEHVHARAQKDIDAIISKVERKARLAKAERIAKELQNT